MERKVDRIVPFGLELDALGIIHLSCYISLLNALSKTVYKISFLLEFGEAKNLEGTVLVFLLDCFRIFESFRYPQNL